MQVLAAATNDESCFKIALYAPVTLQRILTRLKMLSINLKNQHNKPSLTRSK